MSIPRLLSLYQIMKKKADSGVAGVFQNGARLVQVLDCQSLGGQVQVSNNSTDQVQIRVQVSDISTGQVQIEVQVSNDTTGQVQIKVQVVNNSTVSGAGTGKQ